ncbi:TraG/TraD family [Bifidobacterium sp. DSM 109963]|uniref:TraG/TraD family n=2 Tax=Bifidobacterium panos TaxID=2675321 RepID=A0ABX1SYI7_9BIFI|nr:TraG/TraD family [Bifidobacterium sp. DSM 109963]
MFGYLAEGGQCFGIGHVDVVQCQKGFGVVYLELSDTNATFGFLASMFYQCLFGALVRKADHKDGGRFGRDVHCLANIGKISAICGRLFNSYLEIFSST